MAVGASDGSDSPPPTAGSVGASSSLRMTPTTTVDERKIHYIPAGQISQAQDRAPGSRAAGIPIEPPGRAAMIGILGEGTTVPGFAADFRFRSR